ncbi:hypothetical protein Q0Z83_035370 [Actinoplanes sichuanensis]|uniref:NACHT domain-containing protein n=1 Tax=Actinoplanes sichuanensis TaxID=512349 RepID=A0ABW4AAK2_9ACTN|nr:NACHT domain-containing protein [Actinoplanes sichuanensis]BEL05346.1 hypothetical protein Q0Z83_035370 [Actinoplanes sichuanensis]
MLQKRRKQRVAWRPVLVWCGIAACALLLGAVFRWGGLEPAANVAQLVSIPLAMAPLVITWWQSRRKPAAPTTAEIAETRQRLARLVREQWRTESMMRALDDPDPMPVQWRVTGRTHLMDIAPNLTPGVLTVASSSDVTDLVAQFRQLRRRRLVILGGAGAGKTTLAMQILLELLDSRDPDDPVPVLLSLAGWRADRQSLDRWIAERVAHDLPALADDTETVAAMVRQGHVLPVLDGLDESDTDTQRANLAALNQSMISDSQVILTSRVEEYEAAVTAAGRVLSSAVVVEPEPLSPRAAAVYLERCLPPRPPDPWNAVLAELRAGAGPLAEVMTNPLGLWLLRMAYIGPRADPAPLLDRARFPDAATLRSHLLDRLVGAAIEARTPSARPEDLFRPRGRHDPVDAARWLRFIAENLDRWATRDLDWVEDVIRLSTTPAGIPATARFVVAARAALGATSWTPASRDLTVIRAWFGAAAIVVSYALALWAEASVPGIICASVVVAIVAGLLSYALMPADSTDWEEKLTRDWFLVRTVSGWVVPAMARALVHVPLIGVPAGAVACALTGTEDGVRIGACTGIAAGVAGLLYLGVGRAPGAGLKRPWFRVGPAPVVRLALTLALIFFALGLLFYLANLNMERTSPFIVSFVLAAVFAGVFALLHAVFVPVVFGVTSPLTRWLPEAAPARPDDQLGVWRTERAAHYARMLHLAAVGAALGLMAGAVWRAIRGLTFVGDLRTSGLRFAVDNWHATFDLSWDGRLYVVLAVVIAWAATIRRRRLTRSRRDWLWWGVVCAGFIAAYRLIVGDDGMRLGVTGRFQGFTADVDVVVGAEFAGRYRDLRLPRRLALPQTEVDSLVVILPLLIGLFLIAVVARFIYLVEGLQPRSYWSNTVMIRRHVASGRLPADLMGFLDDAHRLGLLRTVGSVYQFRHAELQDHFAGRDQPLVIPAPVRRLPRTY